MTQTLMEARGLKKAYGGKTVLSGIDLAVERGRCVAFIGRNGSGKSTLLRALGGLMELTAGQVTHSKGATIAYVPEHFPRMELTAAQYIRHMARVEGLRPREADEAACALFDMFYLTGLVGEPMKHLSKGTLQKVGVVQALLARHDMLLLDEPLSGQDRDSQQAFVRKMRQVLREGTTILLSCHEPFLVNRLADTVYEIRDGRLHTVLPGDARLMEMDRLHFARGEGAPPAYGPPCLVKAQGDTIIIHAPADSSQAILRDMLDKGYMLRGFYNAGDD